MTVSDERLRQYSEDGFLVLPRLVDGDELRILHESAEVVLSEGDMIYEGEGSARTLLPAGTHPVFDDNAAVRNASKIAEQILGGEFVRLFDMLVRWDSRSPHITPWHQDMAFSRSPFAPAGVAIPLGVIQFCMPLDDGFVPGACIEFLPGRHREPLMEHELISGNPEDPARTLAITAGQADLAEAVPAPVPAGGATVHNYGTPHFTGSNQNSGVPRTSYVFNFVERALLEAAARNAETSAMVDRLRRN